MTQGTTKLHRYLNNTPIITKLKEEHKLAAAAGVIGKSGEGKGAVEAGKNITEPNKRVFNAAADTIAKEKTVTGTVWDSIKATDAMYKGTKIPKSFEIAAKDKKLWVHPNATEHMLEYINRPNYRSHGISINSQTLLRSFEVSVEKAIKNGIPYTDKPIIIDNWELMFSPARKEGLLPVVYHAVYRP